MKVLVNKCFGGFGLSQEALERLVDLGVPESVDTDDAPEGFYIGRWSEKSLERRFSLLDGPFFLPSREEWRDHPLMIQVVEELGAAANGRFAELEIVEIPDDVQWGIDDYDGIETIHEKHRSW